MHLCCWFKEATMLMVQSISLYFQLFLFLCAALLPLLLHSQKFIVLASAISSSSNANDSTDASSLLAFKLMVEDDPLGALGSWSDSLHFCKWEGITCGRHHQRVTILDLSSKLLVSSLSPSLGNLTFLRHLNLENNTFHGRIPEEIGRLTRLQSLVLGNNLFDGEIPRNLSRCSNLINFRVSENKLVGIFPMQILSIYGLKRLAFYVNNIRGVIPSAIANLTSLEILSIGDNFLEGSIPISIGRLKNMKFLELGPNELSGTLPSSICNLSLVETISLVQNHFHGSISLNIGLSFPNLISFEGGANNFTGLIPLSFSNASNLEDLQLSDNNFFGKVAVNFGDMKNLKTLVLGYNHLGNGDHDDLNFLNTLANCSHLLKLGLDNNGFQAVIPNSFANLSTQLSQLAFGNNRLFGEIPSGLGNLVSLSVLGFEGNDFQGNLPLEIGNLQNLGKLCTGWNTLTGEIPTTIGNLTKLIILSLRNNKFHGAIPASIGNCNQLTFLSFHNNRLNGAIPKQVFSLTQVGELLDLSQNKLSGELPHEIGNLKTMTSLDLSDNDFSGTLPSELGSCVSLEYLAMQGNNFHGPIPSSFSSLHGIRVLDLSSNNLSGQIPDYFSKFSMSLLNLSFNNFDGKVPIAGVFSNASAVSLLGNIKLCGGASTLNLRICPDEARRMPQLTRKLKIIISVCTSLFGLVSLSFLLFFFIGKKMERKPKETQLVSKPSLFVEVSYGDLLKATNNFSVDNLIGKGYFSSVYKGVLEQVGQTVAIKVLNLQLRGAVKSFTAECEALRTIRHRNLLKTITSCTTIDFKGNDFKAIVYEFMPKGNLDSWLQSGSQNLNEGRCLNLLQRVNIAIDVAVALDYLHHRCHIPIVHCDLKPSNILLDESMTAHVGDFGLAKLLTGYTKVSEYSSIAIRGTVGYIAPEYGQGSDVSTKGDTYSYGILLLEMITGKRPTDMMFVGELNLHSYVVMALSSQVINIVDSVLLSFIIPIDHKMMNCLVSLLKLGLACSMESPGDRMDIENVIAELHMIKTTVLSMDRQS